MNNTQFEQPTTPTTPTYPMSWFKFLIYFALFAGAVLNLVNGGNFITGGIYFAQTDGQVSADMVYSVYPVMKPVDVIYGLCLVALAVYGIVTRFALAKFKANGPSMLYALYGAALAVSVVYGLIVTAVTGTFSVSGASIATSIVMLICNYKYFNKRAALFCN